MLALQHRDRVCRISLWMPAPNLQKLITAINDEFPILEFLSIGPPTKHNTHLILPSTFQAPQLRLLYLRHFASPIGSPLLTTAVGLSVLQYRTSKDDKVYSARNRFFGGNWVLGSFSGRLEMLKTGFARLFPQFSGLNNF